MDMANFQSTSISRFLALAVAIIVMISFVPGAIIVRSGESYAWPLGLLLITADVLAILGLIRFARSGTTVLMWFAFGANLGLGMATVFGFGAPNLIVAIALLVFAIHGTRQNDQPLFTWSGVLAQMIAFFTFSGLIFISWG